MSGSYRQIAHTADLAIEVEADTLGELFRYAALGMFELIRGEALPGAGPGEWRRIAAEGADREALLVAWLSEILYRHVEEGLLPADARTPQVEGRRAEGEVGFAPAGSGPVERELKGVTYHDLAVERRDGRWHARIVFDV